jgi:hypothetical protein
MMATWAYGRRKPEMVSPSSISNGRKIVTAQSKITTTLELSDCISSQPLYLRLMTVFGMPRPYQACYEWSGVSWSVELTHRGHLGTLLSLINAIGQITIYVYRPRKVLNEALELISLLASDEGGWQVTKSLEFWVAACTCQAVRALVISGEHVCKLSRTNLVCHEVAARKEC